MLVWILCPAQSPLGLPGHPAQAKGTMWELAAPGREFVVPKALGWLWWWLMSFSKCRMSFSKCRMSLKQLQLEGEQWHKRHLWVSPAVCWRRAPAALPWALVGAPEPRQPRGSSARPLWRRDTSPPLAQTLVHTETPSAVSCASATAAPLPLARALNPVNTGQMGTCRSHRLLRTALIPTGKS